MLQTRLVLISLYQRMIDPVRVADTGAPSDVKPSNYPKIIVKTIPSDCPKEKEMGGLEPSISWDYTGA